MFDVGAVVGRLEMNIKGWNAAIDTVKKDQKSVSGLVLRHQDEIKKLGTAFTVAGGAITGMFGILVKKTVDAGDQINDLSKRTGIATETLSAYKLAADQSGTSLEGMATGFRGLARVMNDANTGLAEAKRAFDQLGVAYTDNEGKLRPLDQVMLDVADRFASMPDGAQKTALAMELFGRSGMELIPMLNLGRKGLEENAEAARRLGMVWSQEAAAQADEFNDSVAELQAGLAGAGREIVTTMLPSIKGMIEKVRDIAVGVREWAAEHPVLAGWLSKITLGVGGLMVVTGPLLIALPKLVLGFQALKKLEIGQKIVGQFKGLGDEVSGLSGALKKLPAIGAAAFVGWEIGKLIGDVTGLDHAIEGLTSKIINKFGLWNGSAEAVDLTTDRLAKRQLFLGTASDIAGREISNLGEAIDIIKGAYEKSGTVGNQVLDDWAAKSNAADAATQRLSGGVSGLSKLFQELGVKTRTELVKELGDARSALDQLKGSSEATPGAVQALQEKIKGLSDELYGVDKAGEAFNQWIDGLVPKLSEASTWLGKVDRLFAEGKISEAQYTAALKDLTGKFDQLGIKINRVLPPGRDFRDLIKQTDVALEDEAFGFADAEAAVRSWARELNVGTDKVIAAQLELANLNFMLMGLPAVFPQSVNGFSLMGTEGKKAAKETSVFMQEVSTVVSDSFRNISKGIVSTFGIADALIGQATKHQQEYFDKAKGDVQRDYETKKEALDKEAEDQKKLYDDKREWINKNITDEAQKEDMLEALDLQYEAWYTAHKNTLKANDDWYKSETDRIRADEEKSRQEHADAEERRQNSLWTKVKGIFGTAVEEMATAWLTKFVMKAVGDDVLGLFKGLFGKIGEGATEAMSGAASSAASAVGGITQGASSAISGLWTGLGAAVGSFLGTVLGSLIGGGPSGHQQQQGINDTKDSRNFLADIKNWLFSAGSGFGGAVWDYSQRFTNEKIDEAKGFIAEVKDALAPRIDESNGWLRSIDGRGGDIARALGNLPKAAGGRISTATELVEVHGTPANPELIIPSKDLPSMIRATAYSAAASPKGGNVINFIINLNGKMIATRDFVRGDVMSEMLQAIKSGVLKPEFQQALGVA